MKKQTKSIVNNEWLSKPVTYRGLILLVIFYGLFKMLALIIQLLVVQLW